MNTGTARLVIHLGSQPEQTFPLSKEITNLGREVVNEIVINDPEVSRRHARISARQGGYVVEDMGSTNGTFLNGRRVTSPTPLYQGDKIELGPTTTITFVLSEADATGPVPGHTSEEEYEPLSDDSAEYYARPPAEPLIVPTPPAQRGRNWRRFFTGCGCFILLLLILIAATVVVLDRTAPDLLYCGPLLKVWQTVLEPILNLFGRSINCPVG